LLFRRPLALVAPTSWAPLVGVFAVDEDAFGLIGPRLDGGLESPHHVVILQNHRAGNGHLRTTGALLHSRNVAAVDIHCRLAVCGAALNVVEVPARFNLKPAVDVLAGLPSASVEAVEVLGNFLGGNRCRRKKKIGGYGRPPSYCK